ncbi:pyridoxal 5'-phosphate synthase glutaminase subunit PdxT [Corynebacterium suicordis]|uniref:Pyridoxal 5'-phosphate synthase subunit PdxT n=1 Tax=Corynebacterium suicordis DSM 45110 TaxID=1121369 RepID=A0ABR9ZJA1_9CORY|nr:pyridoxal 5'-phosphate synthase glutaminase subunit PdxT [Corynebacterium suicordis]MBF4553520.1 pyridoxal 5'-phosphate synthase glutaminase subunit PdxT [Corynebacterium suicordis DSM 45110]MDR6277506.1 5'-phosphate synthase pdxT subunit [Corynebacterium suicordis]
MSQQLLIGILAVQGGVTEHVRVMENLGHATRLVRRTEHLEGLDGIVLPGGESTTMSRLLRLSGMIQPLRDAITGGLPAFGTCAGMIMLADNVLDTREDAESLGAIDVTVRRNAFGRQKDSFETSLDFTGIDRPVDAVFIRAPQIEEVGADVQVLAQVDSAVVAARQDHVLVTSFHPELTEDHQVHEYFVQMVREASTRV